MGDCSSTNCCTAGVPDAKPTDGVGPVSAARNITCPRCKGRCSVCGGDVSSHMRMLEHGISLGRRAGYAAGQQDAAWSTYSVNVAMTQERERREAERLNHWRYGE
jgi:hypothetical protein